MGKAAFWIAAALVVVLCLGLIGQAAWLGGRLEVIDSDAQVLYRRQVEWQSRAVKAEREVEELKQQSDRQQNQIDGLRKAYLLEVREHTPNACVFFADTQPPPRR